MKFASINLTFGDMIDYEILVLLKNCYAIIIISKMTLCSSIIDVEEWANQIHKKNILRNN